MGELAASIAHELNQPLAAVVTTAETCLRWLERELPDVDHARAAARRIVRDGNRASEVVRRIRAMVRKALPERTALNINDIIRDVLSLMEAELRKSGVVIHAALADDMPNMQGDRTLLQQVFVNLVTNAIESMTLIDGEHRLLKIESVQQSDGMVAVDVRDTGAGIADDTRERLFDAFVTTKENGMGLGLSICRSIVEAHGGSLSVTTASPRGAVFHVTLSQSGA
jgi:C4-dicarboxylate-specific signal transduction histidine kinase